MKFDLLPQAPRVERLLAAAVAAIPHLPESLRADATAAVKDFEQAVVTTSWDVGTVTSMAGNEVLTEDEKKAALAAFCEGYENKEADFMALDCCIRDVIDNRK